MCVACFPENENAQDGYSFVDAEGREVKLNAVPKRVVSLQGSFAKTWMLAGGSLVGVTTDLQEDFGIVIDGATVVGTVKDPNSEVVVSLSPDFVILSEDIAQHKEIAKLLDTMKITYAYCKQESYSDYLTMLKNFTGITGREDLYVQYGTSVQSAIDSVLDKVKAIEDKPTVLFVRARSQGVSAKATDHMVCTLLDEFGCVNIAKQDNQLLESLSIEQIIKKDPDVILVTTMGDENDAKAYLKNAWESNPAWSELSAVKNNRYIFLPKDLFHFKPNEKWGDAYEYLFEVLF